VSTRTAKESGGAGLSVTTLAIASVSSIAAAIFIHTFWKGGAILGAGITPVIVAIVSESLKRPHQALTSIREERRGRSQVARRTPQGTPMAPPPELERADPFGIWESDRRSAWDRIKGRPLKLALGTGALAFVIGAFALTGAELVFGGSATGGGGDRFTVVPGTQKKSSKDDDKTTKTTETQTTETAPAETRTAPPTVPTTPVPTTPVPTTPTAPEQTPAPTTPAPVTPEAPAPQQPATPPAEAPTG
jgi:hypothetical protein